MLFLIVQKYNAEMAYMSFEQNEMSFRSGQIAPIKYLRMCTCPFVPTAGINLISIKFNIL